MSVDWGETKSILLEVESLFNRDDDIRDVQDIKKMANEIEVYCGNNLKDAKEIIKRECARGWKQCGAAELRAPRATTPPQALPPTRASQLPATGWSI